MVCKSVAVTVTQRLCPRENLVVVGTPELDRGRYVRNAAFVLFSGIGNKDRTVVAGRQGEH